MDYRLDQIKLTLEESLDAVPHKAARLLGVKRDDLTHCIIRRESIDARKKDAIRRVYTVDVTLKPGVKVRGSFRKAEQETYQIPAPGAEILKGRPVVVGMGPAGLMAAYLLAVQGYRPVVLERGQDVDRRTVQVESFWEHGVLDPESNVQFGEGGAGTFSDGKLTCRTRDVRSHWFFEQLVAAGAPPEILYQAKPHVGTDVLKPVVKALRERILQEGGDVRFGARMTSLVMENGEVAGVRLADGTELRSGAVILAIGHSARDTFETLVRQGVLLQPKPLAVGFRIEHPQSLIDQAQYGASAGHPVLGAADYHLTHQTSCGRAVYTFCMCPGGHVVGAASESEHLVVNGMSYHAREGANANSALLVSVTERDYPEGPLGGVQFQRRLEQAAYTLGGGGYSAPVQRVGDFLEGKGSQGVGAVNATYRPFAVEAELRTLLPTALTGALQEGLLAMGRKVRGFDADGALLTAVETRSSSPVRMLRNGETLECVSVQGLYPAGEGAGYAGGIVSSAVDGMKAAEMVIRKYRKSVTE